jgi:hypothetical protein
MRYAIPAVLIAALCASAFTGTMVYSNRVSHIGLLNQQITSLIPQNLRFQNQAANLPSANLNAYLNEKEVTNNLVIVTMYPETTSINVRFNSLWINGSVTNTGQATAFSTGLHVNAYASDGSLKINVTVPLTKAVYGTDSATNGFIQSFPGYIVTIDGGVEQGNVSDGSLALGQVGSPYLGGLAVGQTTNVIVAIYHEGAISNWKITPVWTNSP